MNILKSFKDEVLVPIHPAGWPFIFLFILVSARLAISGCYLFLPRRSFVSLVRVFFS